LKERAVEYDRNKVDEMTLALMFLVSTRQKDGQGATSWKGLNSEVLARLQARALIRETNRKDMSLHLTEEGYLQSERLFLEHFGDPQE
jgi:Domain of unknown function (DUF6429)